MQPGIALGIGRDEASRGFVVVHPACVASAREVVQIVRIAVVAVGKRVMAFGIGERQVDMHAVAALAGHGFWQECQDNAVIQRHFAGHLAE